MDGRDESILGRRVRPGERHKASDENALRAAVRARTIRPGGGIDFDAGPSGTRAAAPGKPTWRWAAVTVAIPGRASGTPPAELVPSTTGRAKVYYRHADSLGDESIKVDGEPREILNYLTNGAAVGDLVRVDWDGGNWCFLGKDCEA